MDYRHNPYKKGRAGHARNVNSYLIYRQKMKKWKYPFMATGVFLLFLLSFQVTGDALKTSVLDGLSSGAPFTFTKENFEVGKKTLVAFLKEELDNCEKVKLDECVREGKTLLHSVTQVLSPKVAQTLLDEVEAFDTRWAPKVSKKLCEKETSESLEKIQASLKTFQNSVRSHEQSLVDAEEASELLRDLEAQLSKTPGAFACK